MIQLKNITTTSDGNDIWRGLLQTKGVPMLSNVGVTFLSSVVVLSLRGQFWMGPLLHICERYASEPQRLSKECKVL
jgi:hypothetical protein